jgi:hypothetical protein
MNVNSLLPNSEYKTQQQAARSLVTKWEKTGLLEGLVEVDKNNMSILLENQAKQLVTEANATGTTAGSEEWNGVALPRTIVKLEQLFCMGIVFYLSLLC